MNWYAVYVRSRYEKKIAASLLNENVECFLPTTMELRSWSDRKKEVEVVLFPGYVFVRIDLHDKLSVLQVDGVVRFAGVKDRPSPIPDHQIESVRIVVGHPQAIRHEKKISAGESIRVASGPFQGVQGIVQRTAGRTRVVISLYTIARSISIEVDPAHLQPIIDREPESEPGRRGLD